jgi:signal transduction histidine kinase
MQTSERSNLLIVDDNPTNLKVLFEFLREYGFKVLVAKDGENALSKLEAVTPDLILLDVMMPGIDGFETCRRIKENPLYQDIPIIFMTALADTESKVRGLSLGAVDYITKPFQYEEAIVRINLHLKLRHLAKELAEKNKQLSEANTQLEKKVEERTTELQKTQSQLILSERMSALGQLMTGIAYEINNPINFVLGNLNHASQYAKNLIHLVSLYQKECPNPSPEITQEIETIDLDFLKNDFLHLLISLHEGSKRIAEISQAMQMFTCNDTKSKVKFDLQDGLNTTLLILRHRLKATALRPAIEVVKDYSQLPEVDCYPGQINQVFMNLVLNAIDAIEEANMGRSYEEILANPNRITVQTFAKLETHQVFIKIHDNGIGMTPEVQQHIFQQSLTTKKAIKGTGLGLVVARQIIEETHGGVLKFTSTPGQGSEFTIVLPSASM